MIYTDIERRWTISGLL